METGAAEIRRREERFTLTDPGSKDDFGASVARGLNAHPKTLEPRLFYDGLGSALFDAICKLPEYYVTRCEWEILRAHAHDIVRLLRHPVRIIEIGAGMARKTRVLLDEITSEIEYVPLDIDTGTLETMGRELIAEYANLRVSAVAGEFRKPSAALQHLPAVKRTAVFFLGSSIGNLDLEDAVAMLLDLRRILLPGDTLLLGADLLKSRAVLEAAYDDALGVTAAFNLNLLQRINSELGGRFRLDRFAHRAFFNEQRSRIEMHIVSTEPQTVPIEALGIEVRFDGGETIHTENSYKYDVAGIETIGKRAGFVIEKKWSDSNGWFTDVLLVAT